jgi:hypothetical protein
MGIKRSHLLASYFTGDHKLAHYHHIGQAPMLSGTREKVIIAS